MEREAFDIERAKKGEVFYYKNWAHPEGNPVTFVGVTPDGKTTGSWKTSIGWQVTTFKDDSLFMEKKPLTPIDRMGLASEWAASQRNSGIFNIPVTREEYNKNWKIGRDAAANKGDSLQITGYGCTFNFIFLD